MSQASRVLRVTFFRKWHGLCKIFHWLLARKLDRVTKKCKSSPCFFSLKKKNMSSMKTSGFPHVKTRYNPWKKSLLLPMEIKFCLWNMIGKLHPWKIISTREKYSKVPLVKNKPLIYPTLPGPLDGYFDGDFVFNFFRG